MPVVSRLRASRNPGDLGVVRVWLVRVRTLPRRYANSRPPPLYCVARPRKRIIPASESQVVLLTGGLGGARLAPALRDALGPGRLTVVANVGDDLAWHGLRVCPDLDSVAYSLAGLWDSERGWGLEGETFRVGDALAGQRVPPWFNVGDRDLALHLLRTERLRAGRSLAQTTKELSRRLGIGDVGLLPASDELSETHMVLEDGRVLHFQEWYVGERATPELREVRLAGGAASRAATHAIESADLLVLGPSNPITSIGAILALEGTREAISKASLRVAVSPVVVGIGSENPGVRHHALARQRAQSGHGLSGADHRGGWVWGWGSRVQVAEDEDRSPKQHEAEDLVCAHADPEERPVEDDCRCREGQLCERCVGGPGAGEAPVVQEQSQEAGDQGEEDQPARLGGEPGAEPTHGALRYHDGGEQWHGQEESRPCQGIEGHVFQDQPSQHGRGSPQERSSQGEERRESFGGAKGLERS